MQRTLNALVYAIVTGCGCITVANRLPENAVQWVGLAGAMIVAGWGKYTTNTELVWPPDRKVWDEVQRREAGLPANPPAT